MIHIIAHPGISTEDSIIMDLPKQEPYLQITIDTQAEIVTLNKLLQRALNVLPPHVEENKDWFELSDRLEKFLASLPKN